MDVTAIVNQKGGVAKTTTAIHLAAGLAQRGHRALLVDMDPQGHAGAGLGLPVPELDRTVYHLLLDSDTELDEVVQPTSVEGLWVAPANIRLAAGSVELSSRIGTEGLLRRKLKPARDAYDFCLVDCPPSLGPLTVIGLTAAHRVLIPTQMSHFSTEGIADLLDTIDLVRRNLERDDLEIVGVLPTMFDRRNSTVNEAVLAELRGYFGEAVFDSPIAKNLDIEKAQARQTTVYEASPQSAGAQSYAAFVEEFLRRIGSHEPTE